MITKIFIFGASGSGTTTLGAAVAGRYGFAHLDTDNFFWEPTDPPFQSVREHELRRKMLAEALDARPRWVLSGCLCGWGDIFIPRFGLAVFLRIPQEIRMARLRERERERYGEAALAPGGSLHGEHLKFMSWAAGYEEGDEAMRSLRLHEKWMASLPCPIVRLEEPMTVQEQLDALQGYL